MRFTVVTIFPEMFESVLAASVLGRARQTGAIAIEFVDPREFTSDRHRSVDDSPYGGGPGMVMKPEPLVQAIESIGSDGPGASSGPDGPGSHRAVHRVLLSPAGAPLTQRRVRELAQLPHIALVCGRYEGIDQRVSELAIDEEISIGDYVLSGGEIAAMAVIDAVARLVPGVLGEAASTHEESFSERLLEYPQYTRPAEYRGLAVPEVLASGDHERIRRWRRAQSLARTAARRPDILAEHVFSAEDEALWTELVEPAGDSATSVTSIGGPHPSLAALAARTHLALVHHPVHDRNRRVVTTAVTNLDIHDIARLTATYGLSGYTVVTPVAAQRDKVERIVTAWSDRMADPEARQRGADNRLEALRTVGLAAEVAELTARLTAPRPPLIVVTSARNNSLIRQYSASGLRRRMAAEPDRPVLLLFGTGWGLADDLVAAADCALTPIRGPAVFNHLSVRSAAAIVLDRLFGRLPGG